MYSDNGCDDETRKGVNDHTSLHAPNNFSRLVIVASMSSQVCVCVRIVDLTRVVVQCCPQNVIYLNVENCGGELLVEMLPTIITTIVYFKTKRCSLLPLPSISIFVYA